MIDSPYLNALLALPGISPINLETAYFLTLARISPIVVAAPFLGAKTAPVMARAGLAIVLSFVFLPITLGSMSNPIPFGSIYPYLFIKELFIGVIFGFFSLIPFLTAQSSGVVIDYLRGSSMLMAQDPSTQTQASPIGILYNWCLIVIYFYLGGPFYFFDAFASSYQVIGLDQFIPSAILQIHSPLWVRLTEVVQDLFRISIQLAAPPILAILMAEVFLGIANRLAPQVQIGFLGMSLKSLFGLMLLWISWFLILKQIGTVSIDWTLSFSNFFTNLVPINSPTS